MDRPMDPSKDYIGYQQRRAVDYNGEVGDPIAVNVAVQNLPVAGRLEPQLSGPAIELPAADEGEFLVAGQGDVCVDFG